MIDTTLASGNPSLFRKSLLERMYKLIMTTDDKLEMKNHNDQTTSDQSRIIEQAKFTFSPLGKAFGKEIKAIEDQGKK